MSGERVAASLDGSLLARKGDAVPAIPDQSPLVFQLDDHRPEQSGVTGVADETNNASAGLTGRISRGLRLVSTRLGQKLSKLRWVVAVVGILFLAAAIWLAVGSEKSSPVVAELSVDPAPVAETGNEVLPLNVSSPPPPQPPVQTPEPEIIADPPTVNAALPAAVALAATEASTNEAAISKLDDPDTIATPQSAPVIPVNIPPAENVPEVGGVDPPPNEAPTLPKSVSPIPVPKAKPDVTAVPTGGRYAVQLASIAIEKRASQEAFRLQKQLGHILGSHEIGIEKAVVNGKGTMYRLRAGGYKTQAEANSACARVAQLKVSCLALRR